MLFEGPMARLAVVIADPEKPGEIFELLTGEEPQTLGEIAREWRLPAGRFVEWYTVEHKERFEAAQRVRALRLEGEALRIADEQHEVVKEGGQKFDPEVPRDKLRVDTRLKLIEKLDRERYGPSLRVEKRIEVVVDEVLLKRAGELLRLVQARVAQSCQEKVVEALPEQPTW